MNITDQHKSFEESNTKLPENRPIWKINFNIWLFIGTVLGIWFTCARGLPILFSGIKPLFAIHLVNACLITWICILNFCHTPSHGPIYRTLHIWLGRISLFFGIASTVLGLATTWYESYEGVTSFSIFISIGGISQVIAQLLAVYFIRKKNVFRHKLYNHVAFFLGCLIPAIMRFPYIVGYDIPYWISYCWIIPLTIGVLSLRSFSYNTWY